MIEVGSREDANDRDRDGRPVRQSWAIEEDVDGFDAVDAWKRAARSRPHDIELAWRHAGVMTKTDNSVATCDDAGRGTTGIRKGPSDLPLW